MGQLNIYIIEDEFLYANQLMILVEELGYKLVGTADNSDTAYGEIVKLKPDLLLVDININGSKDGIELIESIKKEIEITSIFITSFTDQNTFERAKKVNPYAYLNKPFDSTHLQRTIELAIAFNQTKDVVPSKEWEQDIAFKNAFFIKNGHKLEKVVIEEILYVEVEDKYSLLHTDYGKKYALRMSIENMNKKLPQNSFFRCHRKYIVNLPKIKSFDLKDNLLFLGNTSIPISRSNKEALIKRLNSLSC